MRCSACYRQGAGFRYVMFHRARWFHAKCWLRSSIRRKCNDLQSVGERATVSAAEDSAGSTAPSQIIDSLEESTMVPANSTTGR